MKVVDEIVIPITNKAEHYQWKGHGFSLEVPDNAVPEDISNCLINVKVSLASQFELPKGYQLISAIYWVRTPGSLKKPITLHLEHCASFNNPDQLHFIWASREHESIPYKLKVVDGGTFTFASKYGVLSTTHFCGTGVAMEVDPNEHSCKYCAQIYFTIKNLNDYLYYCHFVVTKELEMCLTVSQIKISLQ